MSMFSIMQSFIICAKNQVIISEYLEKIYQDLKIDHFDKTIVDFEKAIGIEEIRNIQKKIYLKPLRGMVKAVVIKNAESLTIEAQNAFLKMLEEPPINTVVILTTYNQDLLLPTIISRCKIIAPEKNEAVLEKKELDENLIALDLFFSASSAGTKLKFAQDFGKNKETGLDFLTKMIMAAREKVIMPIINSEQSEKTLILKQLYFLKSLNKAYQTAKNTNVNPRVILENLFLSLL